MIGVIHVVVCRKPIEGTVAENCLKHGCGAINVDGCRIETSESITTHSRGVCGAFPKRPIEKSVEESGRVIDQRDGLEVGKEHNGRFPANLILDKSDEVQGCFPKEAGASGKASGPTRGKLGTQGRFGSANGDMGDSCFYGDKGSASRFFFNYEEQEIESESI
jgi:site-specific DNA-methyltransferase (adenine-specific)